MSAHAPPSAAWILFLEVEPSEGLDEGVQLRFKAIEPVRPVASVSYEAAGLSGRWRAEPLDAEGNLLHEPALAVAVEDSSDGTARLIFGGDGGLRLTHEPTGTVRREAYLLLSLDAELG